MGVEKSPSRESRLAKHSVLDALAALPREEQAEFMARNMQGIEEAIGKQEIVPKEVGDALLKNVYGFMVIVRNKEKFPELDAKEVTDNIAKHFFAMTQANKTVEERLEEVAVFGIPPEEIAYAMIGTSNARHMIESIGSFGTLDLTRVADGLFASERGHYVEFYWEIFSPHVDIEKIYMRLVQEGVRSPGLHTYLEHAANLLSYEEGSTLDPSPLVNALLDIREFRILGGRVQRFYGIDTTTLKRMVTEVDIESLNSFFLFYKYFVNLPDQSTFARMVLSRENGRETLSRNLGQFNDLDPEIAFTLIRDRENSSATKVLERLSVFKNLNYTEISSLAVERGLGAYVAKQLDKAKKIDTAVILAMYEDWKRHRGFTAPWDMQGFQLLNQYAREQLSVELDPHFTALEEVIGLNIVSSDFYWRFSDRAKEKGINVAKEELRSEYERVRAVCLGSTADVQALKGLQEGFGIELTAAITRFDSSEWGSHGREDLKNIIVRLAQKMDSKEFIHETLSSETRSVQRKAKSEGGKKFVDGFAENYESVVRDMLWGVSARLEPVRALRSLMGEAKELLLTHEKDTRSKIEATTNENARVNLEQRIKLIDAVLGSEEAPRVRIGSKEERIQNLESALKSLVVMSRGKALGKEHSLIRRAAFLVSAINNPQAVHAVEDLSADPKEASLESVSKVMSFMQHITFQETFAGGQGRPALLADTSLKELKKILGTELFDQQLSQYRGGVSKIASTIRFVPTRGLGLELSGHIGDACWASRYALISDEYPTLSAINFVLEPGTKNERVAGSSLLFKTKLQGKETFVIRGLNPLENVINKHDPASFVKELVGYLETQSPGTPIAIVVDTHSGGSSTNRPILYSYLHNLKESLTRADITEEAAEEMNFNGYDIQDHVFYVRSSDVK